MIIVLRNLIFLFSFICLGSCQSDHKNGRKMVGGWASKDVNHDSVKEIANYAMNTINARSNDMFFEKVVNIHEAKAQLVSGVKYNVTFDLSKTICRKNEEKPELCESNQSATVKRCNVTVWDRPWMKPAKRLLHSECKDYLSFPEYKEKFKAVM